MAGGAGGGAGGGGASANPFAALLSGAGGGGGGLLPGGMPPGGAEGVGALLGDPSMQAMMVQMMAMPGFLEQVRAGAGGAVGACMEWEGAVWARARAGGGRWARASAGGGARERRRHQKHARGLDTPTEVAGASLRGVAALGRLRWRRPSLP